MLGYFAELSAVLPPIILFSINFNSTYIQILISLPPLAYISIYIAVSFTIERFIAIRYPLKRQTFCTESLAKKVIVGKYILFHLSLSSVGTKGDESPSTKIV